MGWVGLLDASDQLLHYGILLALVILVPGVVAGHGPDSADDELVRQPGHGDLVGARQPSSGEQPTVFRDERAVALRSEPLAAFADLYRVVAGNDDLVGQLVHQREVDGQHAAIEL